MEQSTLTADELLGHFKSKGAEQAKKFNPEPDPGGSAFTNSAEAQQAAESSTFENFFSRQGTPPPESDEDPASQAPPNSFMAGGDHEPSYKARQSARIVAKMNDFAASQGLAAYAQSPSAKPYKANGEEMEELIDAWAVYLDTVGGEVPPWAVLLLTISFIYGPKFFTAMNHRKLHQGVKYEETKNPEKPDRPADDVEEYEAEEISDDDVDFHAQVYTLNEQARAAGLDQLKSFEPCPESFCKYSWFVNGTKVQANRGQFASQSEQARWGTLMSRYRNAGINYEFLKTTAHA